MISNTSSLSGTGVSESAKLNPALSNMLVALLVLKLIVQLGVTCLMRCSSCQGSYNLLRHSTRSKNTCVRRVVLDKWFPRKRPSFCKYHLASCAS